MPQFDSYFIIGPVVGAVIGYFTNWVAIKMLFRPHEEKRVFGKRIPFTPGLIPSRRFVLAKKVGGAISEHLLTDETLVKSLLSDEVKSSFESVFDTYINELTASGKTIGGIVFGDNEVRYNETVDSLCDKILDNVAVAKLLEKFGKNDSISNKTITELLPDSVLTNIETVIKDNSGAISEKLICAINSSFFTEHIKPIILEIIGQNLKGLASLFVTPEKIYQNIFDTIADYLSNENNYEKTADKLLAVWRVVSESSGVTEAIFSIGERGEMAIGSSYINGLKEDIVKKLIESVFSITPADYLDEIEASLKHFVMTKYDDIIKGSVPVLIKVINLPNIIESKINEFEIDEAEEIIVSVVDRELKAITYFGGILGFVIGIAPPILQSLGIR